MARVVIYSKDNCPYCTFAKQLLTARNIPYQEIAVDLDLEKRLEMEKLSGRRTVPQIFINDRPIGGYDDLVALDKSGELNQLIH